MLSDLGLPIKLHVRLSDFTTLYRFARVCVLNLSITDTLFLLGLPMIMTTAITGRWVFGAVLCRVYYALTCVNMFTGTFTIMLMSIDRFVAVWWPVVCNRSASAHHTRTQTIYYIHLDAPHR